MTIKRSLAYRPKNRSTPRILVPTMNARDARSRLPLSALALVLTIPNLVRAQTAAIRLVSPSGTTSSTTTATTAVSPSPTVVQAPTASPSSSSSSSTPAEFPPRVFSGGIGPRVGGDPRLPAQIQAEHQKHLQKINTLTFDRRPSAILNAWATPPGPKDEPENKKASNSEPKGPSETTTKKPYAYPDPFDAELKNFQRSVTLGDWNAVKAYLAILPENESKPLYSRLLSTLPSTTPSVPAGLPTPPNIQQFSEKAALSHADILSLADASPTPLEDDQINALGRLLMLTIQKGHSVDAFVSQAKSALSKPESDRPLTRRQTAKLLASANAPVEAALFLPDLKTAEKTNDREALNLLSRHYLALNAKDPKPDHLERAWTALQAVLAVGQVDDDEKNQALKAAVELAPKVRDELGASWLSESFAKRPTRGREILSAIGSATSSGLTSQPHDPDGRLKLLELQKTAVLALLKAAPDRASAWKHELELLASAWLSEAEFSHQYDTSTSLGPQLQRDAYGNYYYQQIMMQNQMAQRRNLPQPIKVADILKTRPESAWLNSVDDGFRPRFSASLSKLYLKVAEEDQAFPFIEQLAPSHPDQARDLSEEFLQVWTKNHDPNSDRNRTNMYMYMFGFDRKAESIPLTRSKQERNLKELASWVSRLKKLPIKPVDESLLTRAFTTCHSSAEVYRLDAIEEVFGPIGSLKPETLASLIQQMRANLSGVWRQPAVQEQAKTKRREKDIKAEVLKGYNVARSVIGSALEKHPDAWPLVLARASIHLDENNYRQELDPSSDFSRERRDALEEFALAARLYASALPSLEEKDHSIEPFTMWFYAGLGASDLAAVKPEMVADSKQPSLIRDAIASLPGEAAKEHLDQFANALFTRMSAANPAVKFSYLKAGFEIIGDHEQAHEARKVFDYYKDLVTEIKLDAQLDGPASVGVDQPFGVLVQIRHTREIERESGGFGRYLQNQNNGGMMFYYNYGRPLENYRDKFQKAATDALSENFEVLSVTFEDEKVNSKATSEYGWRVTPYAYLLLKARSPKVDKLPPLRLDLDFLDTTGYAVLPVESPSIPLDAGSEPSQPRPYRNLNITQTLDERQAADGKLILEIKATALGLVPDLPDILKPSSPGFSVSKTEDQGLSIARFDPDSDTTSISSERLWLITFQGDANLKSLPTTFHFAEVLDPDAETTYQRYDDADLAEVESVVSLEQTYGTTRLLWPYYALGALIAVAILTFTIITLRRRQPKQDPSRFRLPETITPFTVLGLLKDIEQNNGLSPSKKQELASSIQSLERHYFADPSPHEPNLLDIAERWVRGTGK